MNINEKVAKYMGDKRLTETDKTVAHEVNIRGLLHLTDFKELRSKLLTMIDDKKINASYEYRARFKMNIARQRDIGGLQFYLANLMLKGDDLGVIK